MNPMELFFGVLGTTVKSLTMSFRRGHCPSQLGQVLVGEILVVLLQSVGRIEVLYGFD